MKILFANVPPPPPVPWWIGELTTPCCGSRIELEANDKVQTRIERSPNGMRWIIFTCPVCKKIVETVKV